MHLPVQVIECGLTLCEDRREMMDKIESYNAVNSVKEKELIERGLCIVMIQWTDAGGKEKPEFEVRAMDIGSLYRVSPDGKGNVWWRYMNRKEDSIGVKGTSVMTSIMHAKYAMDPEHEILAGALRSIAASADLIEQVVRDKVLARSLEEKSEKIRIECRELPLSYECRCRLTYEGRIKYLMVN